MGAARILVRSAEFEAHAVAREGWPKEALPEVAFAGRSNVGKSSVINVLGDRHRLARVSNTPGRTQALLFFRVELVNGALLRLVDLPGYGFARAAKTARQEWQHLVEEYLEARQELRGVVVLLDARRGAQPADRDLLAYLDAEKRKRLVVATKIDEIAKTEQEKVTRRIQTELSLPRLPLIFSTPKKAGREALWQAILSWCRDD